jgi:hypothetical protein
MRRHVIALMVALNAALAIVLAAMWVTPQGTLRNVAWQPPAPVKPEFSAAAAPGSQVDPGSLMASVDRPLFSPSRLPPPVKAAGAAAPPVDPLSNIRLHGVYVGQGTGGIIATVDGKSRRFRLNERVGEWTVAGIKDRDVTFTRAGESRVIRLATSGSAPQSGIAAAAAPGAASQAPSNTPRTSKQKLIEERQRMLEQRRARRTGQ